MDFISMLLVLLQVSSAARRPIQVTGEVGGSITIKCPITGTFVRKFWCRELSTGTCVTIISTTPYIAESYENRISITDHPEEGIFQIAMRSLEERDAGLYGCGTGFQNDRGSGRTLQVELKVSNGNVASPRGMLSPESLPRDRSAVTSLPWLVPAESGNKGADAQAVTQPQMMNRARTKYASYAAPGIEFPEVMTIMPKEVIGSTVTYATTGSMTKGMPKNSRTTSYAHHIHTKSLLRSRGKDVFQILIPVLLVIMLLVASMIIVRKQLRGKKGITIYMFGCFGEAASSETYGINLRLSALQHVQEHIPAENIYSICPRRLQGAERNSSHVPHESYHCRVDVQEPL
ncbi:immunoglobulin mu Fc receptor [Emydura macquarii macquarii]|uniref:immunoglobulin mu Fc receptor n=1 Tax=Emydura macquarii macquarii TaxID=1129001 RepID=UPI00352B4EDC